MLFLVSWNTLHSTEKARTHSIENLCYSVLTKFFEVLPKIVHHFSSYLCQFDQIAEWQVSDFVLCIIMVCCRPNKLLLWDVKEKQKSMFRLPQKDQDQGVLSHQTFLVKNFLFCQPPQKQDDQCAFKWVLITDGRFKAASWTFVKKKGNVEHYFKDEFDFWNDW